MLELMTHRCQASSLQRKPGLRRGSIFPQLSLQMTTKLPSRCGRGLPPGSRSILPSLCRC